MALLSSHNVIYGPIGGLEPTSKRDLIPYASNGKESNETENIDRKQLHYYLSLITMDFVINCVIICYQLQWHLLFVAVLDVINAIGLHYMLLL